MANILIQLCGGPLTELVDDIIHNLSNRGHLIDLKEKAFGEVVTREDYDSIIWSDIIVFFLTAFNADRLFETKAKLIIETAEIDSKIRITVFIPYPEAEVNINLAALDFDEIYPIRTNWEQNIYAESTRILQGLSSVILPEEDKQEIKIKKEIKANIEENSPEFIKTAIEGLKTRGENLNIFANIYFAIGLLSIGLSIYISCTTVKQFIDYITVSESWPVAIFLIVKGIIVISLFVALSKYAVGLGKAYMHESLKVKERIHAISFGQFYLNVYKEQVTPTELKEVFRDWNITNQSSAFTSQVNNDIDPKILEGVANIVEKSKDVVKTVTEAAK